MSPETDLVCLDDAEVVVRCEDHRSVEVHFAERHAVDERLVFSVRLRAPGLDARLDGITNAVEGRGLARFLDGLDFRGWQGELIWTNADDDLAVSAVFESRGHIALAWTIRPWRHSAHGRWSASATTWLEAGAAKDDLAAQLHAFLAAPEAVGPFPLPPVLGDPTVDVAAELAASREEERW